jgi:hypothetical protein
VKASTKNSAINAGANSRKGRHWPQRVRVRSTQRPTMMSHTASAKRTSSSTVPMTAALRPTTSV